MIKNPVLTGFHPDPSMICVDGVFYLANSTFEYFPGVKISASRDLANWETVCYPLDSLDMLDMRGDAASGGIWAPCLSYSAGIFFLVFTDVKTHGPFHFLDAENYITTARDIKGPWSKPVYVNSSGFDPSLFHDQDGRKYYVNMEQDYRRYGSDAFTGILLTELDPVTLEPISDPVKIFGGTDCGYTEGPHLYKKNGWYYLLAAEGGTEYMHAATVARARDILGPYEVHPNVNLLSTKQAPESCLQKTGHASLCQGPDGRWWAAFLCARPLEGTNRCVLGRETGINEIVWENDWPYLKNGKLVPDVCFEGYGEKAIQPAVSYDFGSERFRLDFQSLRKPARYEVLSSGALRLYGGSSLCSVHDQALLARRQTDFSFRATTCVSLPFDHYMKMAGLSYRYDESCQYYLRIAYNEQNNCKCLGILKLDQNKFTMPLGQDEIPVGDVPVWLRVTVRGAKGYFSYSLDGSKFTDIDYEIDASILSDDYGDLTFTGAYVGMACQDGVYRRAYADFDSFEYQPLDE